MKIFNLQRTNAEPLVFFVHIPKSLGTSVNAHLLQWSNNGRAHCQSIMRLDQKMRRAARESDWLSGHVNVRHMQRVIQKHTDRNIRFFTCIRNPVDQIRSHYNWVLSLAERGAYETSPERIQKAHEALISSDNNCPDAVIRNLQNHADMFLNFQSRVAMLNRGAIVSARTIKKSLDHYEMIGTEDTVHRVIERITGETLEVSRLNTNRYRFDAEIFESPRVQKFLEQEHSADFLLYEAALKAW